MGLDCQRDSIEIRRHLGYLPGDLALYPKLTGRETLEFFANLRGGVDWGHVESLAERLDADLSPARRRALDRQTARRWD